MVCINRLIGLAIAGVLGMHQAQAESTALKLVALQPLDRPNLVAERAVLDLAFARAGLQYTLDYNPAERALQAFIKGNFDGDINRVATFHQIYPEAIRVEPHIQSGFFFAIGRGGRPQPASWDGLADGRVAYVRGYRSIELRMPPTAKREVVSSETACLSMAALGRVDWCVLGADTRAEWPLQARFGEQLSGSLIDSVNVHIWLGPQHKLAAERLSKALDEMEKSGELQRMMAPYR